MATRRTSFALVALLVLAAWAFFYRLGDIPLLDDPSEGEYAEVAREMVESGEWLTPRLNYVPFLNKPPLTYWAIALTYELRGVNELAARGFSAATGLIVVALTVWLGSVVFDMPTGLCAGFILTAMMGFFVETHEVRPDLPLTASIVAAMIAIAKMFAPRSNDAGSARAPEPTNLLALQVALAAGVMSKGLLGLVICGVVVALLVRSERRFDLLRRLVHPRAWWLFLLIVAPWHLAMSWRYSGFAWDYIINQHVLFFFDGKLPRDSTPLSVAGFWTALALRLFPWTLFAPLAVAAALRQARQPGRDRFGCRLLMSWAGVVLLFFSAASSRLEHYSIPALPALALLLAKLFREYTSDSRERSRPLTGAVVGFAAVLLSMRVWLPAVVRAQDWLQPNETFVSLAMRIDGLWAAAAMVAAGAAATRRRRLVLPVIVAASVALIPPFLDGMALMARVNSSAGLATEVRRRVSNEAHDARVVLEVPVEYQYCAPFLFYLGRRVDMLEPHGFVAPTYLESRRAQLFIDRRELERLWRTTSVFLVTNPLSPHAGIDRVPQPRRIVASDYARQVLSNRPE